MKRRLLCMLAVTMLVTNMPQVALANEVVEISEAEVETETEADDPEENDTMTVSEVDEAEVVSSFDGEEVVGTASEILEEFLFDSDTGTIKEYIGSSKEIVIPASINGTPVKIIGDGAFRDKGIMSVSLPEGLKKIGAEAFKGCPFGLPDIEKLGTVVIPSTVEEVGGKAFYQCSCLGKIEFKEETTSSSNITELKYQFPNGIFEDCKNLREVILSSKIRTIPEEAFSGCSALKTVLWKDKLETIDAEAFKNCSALEELKLEQVTELTSIKKFAFENCTSLKLLTFPEKLKEIGEAAFTNCPLGLPDMEKLGTVVIPSSIETVDARAFYKCSCLEKVVFEEETISSSNITELKYRFPNGIFEDCKNLREVVLSSKIRTIPENAFSGCSALKTVLWKDKLETIGTGAFKNCSALEELDLNKVTELTSIKAYAFENCTSLKLLTFPKKLKEIGEAAFTNCPLGLPDTEKLGVLVIPSTVEEVGGKAFYKCSFLEKVVFEEGDTTSGNMVTTNLKYEFPNGIFEDCKRLKEVTFSSKIRTIPEKAFFGCSELETIIWNGKLEQIDAEAFRGCSQLENLKLNEVTELISIGRGAFEDCVGLKTVTFPNKLKTIGSGAFRNCPFGDGGDTLGKITFPSTIESIEKEAFRNCKCLGEIYFEQESNAATSLATATIGEYAFADNPNLAAVTIFSKVKKLGRTVFDNDKSIKYLVIMGKDTELEKGILDGVNKSGLTIYCSNNSLAKNFADTYSFKTASLENIPAFVYTNEYVITMVKGETRKRTEKNVTFTTSNKKIVSVSKKGVIKALKAGTATITIKSDNSTEEVYITVEEPRVSAKTVYVIKDKTAEAGIQNTTLKPTWIISNPKIAAYENGVVTGLKKGTTKLTAVIHGKKYAATIRVEEPKQSKYSKYIKLKKKATLKLSGTKQKPVWTSSDTAKATVDSKGKVTATALGTVKITATIADSVYTWDLEMIPNETPKLVDKKANLSVGETKQLSLKNSAMAVEWSSANENIAQVSETGLVTAKGEGTTKIYAMVYGKKYTVKVVVK